MEVDDEKDKTNSMHDRSMSKNSPDAEFEKSDSWVLAQQWFHLIRFEIQTAIVGQVLGVIQDA